MKLRHIRIKQFRQFRQPLVINNLRDGLNLFAGPNESGKSTVVHAIRAAFFERHRSGSADELQPWGDTSASPEVQLEFDWQGERWKLSKRFLKMRRCDLEIAGRTLTGDEAEAQVAELLGFQYSARGASKAEHWGIPGLLWIEQGQAQDIRTPAMHAGDYLKSALGASLGELASSTGDLLQSRVQAERAHLLTATGRPTGQYAAIIRQQEECQAQLSGIDSKIGLYRQQVDRLGELLQQQKMDAAQPWEVFYKKAQQAQAELDQVEALRQLQQQEQKELQDCQLSRQLCQEQLSGFVSQQQDLEHRLRSREQADQALTSLQGQRAQFESRLAQARTTWQQAELQLRQARQHEQRLALERELQHLEQQLADVGHRLLQARQVHDRLLEQRSQLQVNRVDPAAQKRLNSLIRELEDLNIAQQSVATQLHYQLLPDQSLQLDAEVLYGEGQRMLLEPVSLEIPGVGQLRIQPGGEDIGDLVRRLQAARDRLGALLQELGVATAEQALACAEQYQVLSQSLANDERQLKILAPQGMDELVSQQTLHQKRKQSIQSDLAALSQSKEVGVQVPEAEVSLENARVQLHGAEQANTEFEKSLGLAQQARDTADAEWHRLQKTIQAPDRQAREQALNQQLVNLLAKDAALQDSLNARLRIIEANRPDILLQDVKRYERSAQALQQEAKQRERELLRLQTELELSGADGLEEQRANLSLQLEAMTRRRAELDRRSAALDLLLSLLNEKRQVLTRRIQAPLQRHLNHYLQLLFPQASLSVDQDLVPDQLLRLQQEQETYEAYEGLSFGAREQMGLISRLAYADLLKEAGRPTLILLDDILVHSDAQRLAQMKRILFDAAQRHQILLFTCHPEDWQDLGVPAVAMQMLQANPTPDVIAS